METIKATLYNFLSSATNNPEKEQLTRFLQELHSVALWLHFWTLYIHHMLPFNIQLVSLSFFRFGSCHWHQYVFALLSFWYIESLWTATCAVVPNTSYHVLTNTSSINIAWLSCVNINKETYMQDLSFGFAHSRKKQ